MTSDSSRIDINYATYHQGYQLHHQGCFCLQLSCYTKGSWTVMATVTLSGLAHVRPSELIRRATTCRLHSLLTTHRSSPHKQEVVHVHKSDNGANTQTTTSRARQNIEVWSATMWKAARLVPLVLAVVVTTCKDVQVSGCGHCAAQLVAFTND